MSSKTLIVALEFIRERVRQRRQIAPETTFLLAEIKADWKLWWRYASAEEKAEIIAYGRSTEEQQKFASEIAGWTNQQWPEHPQASEALMFQLLDLEPFSTWSTLRRELDHKCSSAYGVAVPGKDTACRDHIWRLRVWLVPKLEGEPKSVLAIPLNFETQDLAAKNAPSDVIRAIHPTLHGLARRCFLWFLKHGWEQSHFEKPLIQIASSTILLLLVLLAVLPDPFLKDDLPVALGLEILIVSAAVMLITLCGSVFRQYKSVLKDLEAWLSLLSQSRVLMATSSQQPPIKGASFSVTLAVSLLLALDKSKPAQSAFVRETVSRLRVCAEEWLFTGCLNSDGTFGPVDYLAEKLRALIDFNEVADRPLKVLVQSNETASEEFKQPAECRVSSSPASPDCVHAGLPPDAPELRSYTRLLDLLFEKGAWTQYAQGVLLMIASVCFAVLALWTSFFELSRIINPPAIPKASMTLSPADTELRASITIYSPESDQFIAKIRSDYWQSCILKRFPRSGDSDLSSTIGFSLIKSPGIRPGSRAGEGTVELVRIRSVLWRSLPPVEKLSITTFDDLNNSGPPSR